MQHWKLHDVDAPEGIRSPAVLHSQDGERRVLLLRVGPGQAMGDHQVKESALLLVVEGRVRVEVGDESIDADAGELFRFEPNERHSVTSDAGARVLLLLAPWPGDGHYRGDAVSASSPA